MQKITNTMEITEEITENLEKPEIITDDLAALMDVLPKDIRAVLVDLGRRDDLLEVILDLGRSCLAGPASRAGVHDGFRRRGAIAGLAGRPGNGRSRMPCQAACSSKVLI